MKIIMEFDSENEDDMVHYQKCQQADAMLNVLLTMTGRYTTSSHYPYGFKQLVKYDGTAELMKAARKKLNEANDNESPWFIAVTEADVAHKMVSDMEDAFYQLLQEYNVNLNID